MVFSSYTSFVTFWIWRKNSDDVFRKRDLPMLMYFNIAIDPLNHWCTCFCRSGRALIRLSSLTDHVPTFIYYGRPASFVSLCQFFLSSFFSSPRRLFASFGSVTIPHVWSNPAVVFTCRSETRSKPYLGLSAPSSQLSFFKVCPSRSIEGHVPSSPRSQQLQIWDRTTFSIVPTIGATDRYRGDWGSLARGPQKSYRVGRKFRRKWLLCVSRQGRDCRSPSNSSTRR